MEPHTQDFTSTTSLAPASMEHREDAVADKPLTDTDRLRMLGYDAQLGRPFGFWGLFGMNFCNESILYEFLLGTSLYSYQAPLIFIIGYPFQFLFHLILLGPMAELASAFPVSGATATWAWRCARAGVRHERQWGWLVSGLVLAAHLGRAFATLYSGALGLTSIYITMAHIPTVDALSGEAKDPQEWWNPVFYLTLITAALVLVVTRAGRTNSFWIGATVLYMLFVIVAFVMLIMGGVKNRGIPFSVTSMPGRKQWTHSFGFMIFTGLPLKMIAVDCPAHMAEETKNPARTVPRAMYASTIAHFVLVYALVLTYTFCLVPKFGPLGGITSPFIPIVLSLGLNVSATYTFIICGVILGNLQILSGVIVMSRFVFALARDCAIPFSNFLARTSKGGEPWAAEVVIFASLYVSIAAWWVNANNYYNLVMTFGYWFMTLPFVITLTLYVLSDLDLKYVDRTQFSLGKWSKPMACFSVLWGILTLVQGSFPIQEWGILTVKLKKNTLSFLPFVIAGMIVVMIVSWFLYGRRHYIGPIRALTKWSAGVEINPKDYTTPEGRSRAIRSYILAQTRGPKQPARGSIFSRGNARTPSVPRNHGATFLNNLFREAQQEMDVEARATEELGRNGSRSSRSRGARHESFAMGDVSRSRGSNGRERQESQFQRSTYVAQQESQLEPEASYPAQQESQLEPEASHLQRSSYTSQQESRQESLQLQTYSQQESQLRSHAQIESQLEPVHESQLEPEYTFPIRRTLGVPPPKRWR